MQPFETIEVDDTVVGCNGGGGPLGHPRVFLNLLPAGQVECPYCSRLFVKRGHVPQPPRQNPVKPPLKP